MIFWALTAFAFSAFAENPEMAIDKMTDDELRAFRKRKVGTWMEYAFEVEVTAKR